MKKPKFNLREFYGGNGHTLAHRVREAKLGKRETGRDTVSRLRVCEITRVPGADTERWSTKLARRERVLESVRK